MKRDSLNHYNPANASQFNVKITRTGTSDGIVNIPLFGFMASQSAYKSLSVTFTSISFGMNGAGLSQTQNVDTSGAEVAVTTLSSPTLANADKAVFSFANDSVVVETESSANYPDLVAATAAGSFNIQKMRLRVPNVAGVDQFNQNITAIKKTTFGKVTENSIAPGAYIQPDQFQSTVVDVPQQLTIDRETTLMVSLLAIAQTYTLSLFVDNQIKPL